MLSTAQIEAAAVLLADARRNNAVIDAIPEMIRPRSLKEAYAIQDRMIELMEVNTSGWFGACTNENIQQMLGLDEPYYAYLLTDHIYQSSAVIDTVLYPPMVFECEFGFVVDRDFSPQGYPYSRRSIEEAITHVRPVIEIVAGHLKDWPNQDVFSVIADNGTDGAVVIGEGTTEWQSIDLTTTAVTLHVNGNLEKEGTGANVLGDPLSAFVWLVNAVTRDNKWISAGDVHNTGTATEIYWANPGITARADFGPVGCVSLELK